MAVINVDLSKAKDNLIPEGEYQAFVFDVVKRENKTQDGEYLNWHFKIAEGDYQGRSAFMITSLKETALFRLKDVLIALGVPIPEDGQLQLDTEDLLTKKCTIVVEHREYNGKMQVNVKDVLPPKEEEKDPFEEEY